MSIPPPKTRQVTLQKIKNQRTALIFISSAADYPAALMMFILATLGKLSTVEIQ
jgi:hypothetical protein